MSVTPPTRPASRAPLARRGEPRRAPGWPPAGAASLPRLQVAQVFDLPRLPIGPEPDHLARPPLGPDEDRVRGARNEPLDPVDPVLVRADRRALVPEPLRLPLGRRRLAAPERQHGPLAGLAGRVEGP